MNKINELIATIIIANIMLLGFKMSGSITISWWWVLLPSIITLGLFLIAIGFIFYLRHQKIKK